MIELRGVTQCYNSTIALDAIDLCIQPGQTTVLIGPSGCGKSTTLRVMIGLITPSTGQVLFQSQPLNARNINSIRRQMGYVIQEGGLFPHLTARGNITLMARFLRWPAPKIHARLDELTSLTQIQAPLLDRYPTELSGGQRQRISLMRALMLDPAVLLLDEPLGSLDPMVRYELQADLKAIFQSLRKTVVLVTHDIGEAAYLGDQIVLMREGKIVQRGAPMDLVERPADPWVLRFVNAQRSPFDLVPAGSHET
jgi:osmoprotectant transport system ATP-binding protein